MKKRLSKLRIAFISGVAVLVVAGVVTFILLAQPNRATAQTASAAANFGFDASKATGWFAGSNVRGASGENLATVTRIIAQGTEAQPTGDCFVKFSYWAGASKSLDQVLADAATSSKPDDLVPVDTTTASMATPTGPVAFEVHQYKLTGPDASQSSDGEAFAVLKTGDGYIEIAAYCKTADELALTLPVLSAVSFTE